VDGYSCIRLGDPEINKYKNTEDVVILIGIHNRDADPYQIKSELCELGFCNVYTPIEYYNELTDGVENPYWLAKSDFYNKNIDNIKNVYLKIENKEVFIDILQYRLGYSNTLKYAKSYSQYRPDPILKNMVFSNFIDAGAYNGDSIKDFILNGISVTNYYAYEPDLKNYTDLAVAVQAYNFKKYLFPSGLSNVNGKLSFRSNGEAGMCVEQLNFGQAYETVSVIRLDDSLQGDVAIDFIKMDIEGLENSAILGAREIIKAQNPVLAICVYHKPDDLWTILQTIENIAPEVYKYYLYQHELNTFEVVLYAIPR
jgi:FkbM family methyltransferase